MLHNNNKPAILVAFPSMKNRNTGFYYFGRSLGNALLGQNKKFNLTYYLPKSGCDEFNWLGDTNDTLLYSSLLFLPQRLTESKL